MKYKDYYQTLGVARGASQDDIKRAFRRLAHKHHPDKSKEVGAEERFKEANEAYEVLGDPARRTAYDQLGSHAGGQEFRPPPEWGARYAGGRGFDASRGADFSDLFAELFGAHGRHGGPRPTRDYDAEVEISLEEAMHGAERRVRLDSGFAVRGAHHPQVTVRIPKGVTDGEKLRVPRVGPKGEDVLHLRIRIAPDPRFRLDGHDLHLELPIAPWEAVLGAAIEAPTPTGKVRIKTPAGATSGQRMRLAGKGLPRRGEAAGDLYLTLRIVTPTELSTRERALLEEWRGLSKFNPRPGFDE
jgi:curved DNA-binding protein